MALSQNVCPSCAATIDVSGNETSVRCPYCRTSLTVERKDGYQTVQIAQEMSGAIERTSAMTHAAIEENTTVARDELRRLQLSQELSNAKLRLSSTRSEIRALQRADQNRTTKAQLAELQQEERVLQQTIADLEETLNPKPVMPSMEPSVNAEPRNPIRLATLFGFSGRLRRRHYWLGIVPIGILFIITSGIVSAAEEDPSLACLQFIAVIASILAMWIAAALTVRRFHDRGKSGWWAWILFVPIIGPFWILIDAGFLAGTAGTNAYGPSPR